MRDGLLAATERDVDLAQAVVDLGGHGCTGFKHQHLFEEPQRLLALALAVRESKC